MRPALSVFYLFIYFISLVSLIPRKSLPFNANKCVSVLLSFESAKHAKIWVCSNVCFYSYIIQLLFFPVTHSYIDFASPLLRALLFLLCYIRFKLSWFFFKKKKLLKYMENNHNFFLASFDFSIGTKFKCNLFSNAR